MYRHYTFNVIGPVNGEKRGRTNQSAVEGEKRGRKCAQKKMTSANRYSESREDSYGNVNELNKTSKDLYI